MFECLDIFPGGWDFDRDVDVQGGIMDDALL